MLAEPRSASRPAISRCTVGAPEVHECKIKEARQMRVAPERRGWDTWLTTGEGGVFALANLHVGDAACRDPHCAQANLDAAGVLLDGLPAGRVMR